MTPATPRIQKLTPAVSIAIMMAVALALLMPALSGKPASAYGHASATFSGKVTVDGEPAPAGTQVIVTNLYGGILGSGMTGAAGLPPGEYSILVPESNAPAENSIVTVTLSGNFAETRSVDIRYVYFGLPAIADIASFTSPVAPDPEVGEGEAFISMPQFVNISPQATAMSGNGQSLRVIGGTVRMEAVGETVAIPVSLLGSTLETLDDPVSGITVRRVDGQMLIRIPFMDADGNDTIRVLVDSADLTGKGFHASGEITGLRIDAPTRSRDFTQFDDRVATGSVKVLGNINTYPGNSWLEMSMVPAPSAADAARLEEALAERDEEATDFAFSVEFDKTRLESALGAITLQLTVGKAWFDAQESASVVVARLADDGTEQFFPFVPIDPEADPVRFDLESPDGLSAFVITAVREAAPPTPTPDPTATPTPTPTATPSPTTTPVATPAQFPTVQPTATAAGDPTAPALPTVIPATPIPIPATATPTTESAATPVNDGGGGSCNAASDGHVSVGQVALLLSPLALLVLRSRVSR